LPPAGARNFRANVGRSIISAAILSRPIYFRGKAWPVAGLGFQPNPCALQQIPFKSAA